MKLFLKRTVKALLEPAICRAVAALLTLFAIVLVAGYQTATRQVTAANLTKSGNAAGTTVFAAPKSIRRGQEISRTEIVAHLQRIGYQQREGADTGTYQLSGSKTLHISTRYPDFGYQTATITFDKNRISAIHTDKGEVANLEIEPQAFGSFFTLTKDEKTYPMRVRRTIVGPQDVVASKYYKCLVAVEDAGFETEHGIAWRGIARAFITGNGGGSGLTQQVAKNAFARDISRTYWRKLQEAFLALSIERNFTKPEIAALHSNNSSFGRVRNGGPTLMGVLAAAQELFGITSLSDLSLEQSATLAGMHKKPDEYLLAAQNGDYSIITDRRNYVLDRVREVFHDEFSVEEVERAKAQPVKFLFVSQTQQSAGDMFSRHFEKYAASQVEKLTGLTDAENLRIYTTVDMDLQRAAYAAVTKQLSALDKRFAKRIPPGTLQAALVAMNVKTGEIVAMVGGRDFEKSQFNRATDAQRQPGSVFKPFVYATALNTAFNPNARRVITPATVYMDAPKTFKFGNQSYAPGNFGDKYSYQPVTLRYALTHSLNVVTVDVALEVRIDEVMSFAEKAGLPKPQRAYPAMALGTSEATPLQIASAYTAFAASGTRATPVAISRVMTGQGQAVPASTFSGQRFDVMHPEVAYIITSILKDVVNHGTAAALRARGFKANVAGKTGTSRDGWFVGYTPSIVCAVYVGFDDGSQLGLTGADSALPIWADFMTAALNMHPEWGGDWQIPVGIQQIDINPPVGHLASSDGQVKRTELFIKGTIPLGSGDSSK